MVISLTFNFFSFLYLIKDKITPEMLIMKKPFWKYQIALRFEYFCGVNDKIVIIPFQ